MAREDKPVHEQRKLLSFNALLLWKRDASDSHLCEERHYQRNGDKVYPCSRDSLEILWGSCSVLQDRKFFLLCYKL